MLLISIISHLIRSVTWQLSKFVMILSYRHRSLFQSSKFLLLELYQSFWYVIGSKILSKFLPGDRRSISGTSILECLPQVVLTCTTPSAGHHTALCWVAFPLHEANHLLLVDQCHERTPGDAPSRIHHAYRAVLHQPVGSADSAPTLAWAMSALPEVAQLSLLVLVLDVGEHLHDLGLFLFQTLSYPILHSKTKYSYVCAQDVQTHTYITNCNNIKVKYLLHRISHHNVNT